MIHSANQHPMTRIAYNEHRPAPRLSASFKRRNETDMFGLGKEINETRNDARRNRARVKAGPAQPAPKPRRARAVKRDTRRAISAAVKAGDLKKAKRLAQSLGLDLVVGGVKL
jgi:hypothetical protein